MKNIKYKEIYKEIKIFQKRGFTLIELMVSVSVFSIVMLLSMGSILGVLDANQKSQTLRTVMDNLNFTLEGMTRSIRFGQNYHCGSGGDPALPADCASGNSSMSVTTSSGRIFTYKLVGGRISRSINGGADYFITSPDTTIQSLTFRVLGSSAYAGGSDTFQPEVIITISGFAGVKPTTKSSFTLETTVSQRSLDL